MSESKMGQAVIFELFVTSLRLDGGWKIESQEIKTILNIFTKKLKWSNYLLCL